MAVHVPHVGHDLGREPVISSPHLEIESSPLVDREEDLAAVSALLLTEEVRLLTLTGPAGVGKTRLALTVGRAVAAHFPQGVLFVDLAPHHDPGLVFQALAKSLVMAEVPGAGGALERLEAALRDRHMLLILDNAEQVLQVASGLAELLAAAPLITVLVTSRESLHLRWEQLYHVLPLPTPDPEHLPALRELAQIPSVALFLQRARTLSPDFVLSEGNAQAVAELCVHLDGLPLALELAAARTSLLSPRMILERLGQRLSLLHWEAQDLPERQQTLRSALDWSFDLLSREEQSLFRRLGVFVGRFSLEAVEAITRDIRELVPELSVVDGLASLVDKSLVQVHVAEGEGVFYSMLESIREYALERLAEARGQDAAGHAHALYYLALAERAEPELTGPRQRDWLLRLEEKHGNLRAALHWFMDHDEGEPALRLATALGHFWEARGYLAEGQHELEEALSRTPAADPSLRARALTWLGALLVHNDGTGADGHDEAAHAEEVLAQALDLARVAGDGLDKARALTYLGLLSLRTREWKQGERFLEEAHGYWQEARHAWGCAQVVHARGAIAFLQGHHDEAAQLAEETLSRSHDVGDDWARGMALLVLLSVTGTQGELRRAARLGQELLAVSTGSRNQLLMSACAGGVAWLLRDHTAPEQLAHLVGAAETVHASMGFVGRLIQEMYVSSAKETLRARMGQERLDAALCAGRRLSFAQLAALIGEVLEDAARAPARHENTVARNHPGISLSAREQEVLKSVARGLSNKQIAAELIIAESTVRYHLTSIFNKLGVDTRTHALAVAAQRGLIHLGEET